ncbi:WD40 repeat domain-containing protein [Anabaena subtropica]|uniref:WD40 repeat domain-containing protein n=1 Tax=Anabaena subtropica FACHB-260 TaxID=2692884 RepID=A0ABR8CWI5_9NOST|nr:WD40 repeat domain-containing protein [Anabaena subtropica]MBD2346724.1 WD40 repeat domain-containing protein [Anabaena subtropica FACHB-260]
MSSFLLDQLVHTSFPVVGFRTVVSTEVPTEIQQAFIQQVVYQHWDSYNPPSPGYRAAYLYQVTSEHSLFGWLYNDGLDDFGRSNVPYFVCYYLAGKLQPIQLEDIFICLRTGPITLIDRQNFPVSLTSLVAPDLKSYQPARTGVEIPKEMIEQSQKALQRGEILNLFVFEQEEKVPPISIAEQNLFSSTKDKALPPVMVGASRHHAIIKSQKNRSSAQSIPLSAQSAKEYQRILLTQAHLRNQQKAVPLSGKLTLMLTIIASMTSLLTLVLGVYYFLNFTPFAGSVPQTPEPTPTSNPALEEKDITPTQTLAGHADSVWSVVLTRDGQNLVSASADKTIKVWHLETGKVISTLKGHTNIVRAIALSPDGKTLISGSGDNNIKLWDFQTFKLKRTLTSYSGAVWSVAISRDGQTLVSGHECGRVKIWNPHTGKLLRIIRTHRGRVFSVDLNPDGKTIATGGIDKTIKIWDVRTGKLLRTIAQHQDAVRSVVFSRDGKTLASASWDKTIKIWNMQTGALVHTLVGHTAQLATLSLGIDGQTLVSGSVDRDVKIWNMQTGKLLDTLSGHAGGILAIATNSEKQILVSSSKDKTMRIWQR